MYELVKAGENTYYIDMPAKVGIYKYNNNDVCVIDTGNDRDAGKRVLKVISEQGWNLKMIINTHSHADHVGGNKLLQDRTGCKAYCVGVDTFMAQATILEPAVMYGGYPYKELRTKYMVAQSSDVEELTEDKLPSGLTMKKLKGHSADMVAIRTSDNVWFLGDALVSEDLLRKYNVSYVFDVGEYLKSLHEIKKLEGKLFIPSHAPATSDIESLVAVNLKSVKENINALLEICSKPISYDDILAKVFERFNMNINYNQYYIVGGTIRGYLSYLKDQGIINTEFVGYKLLWNTVSNNI